MSSNREKLVAGAQKLVEKGQYDRAVREYLKVVAEDDKDVRVWLKVGDLYVKLGRHQEAAQAYQRVAQYYSDQGFFLKAVAVYKQIIKIEPNLIEINLRLADLFKQLGLLSDAKAQYQEVAAYYRREGKSQEALAALAQMVELEPDDVASRILLAEAYCREQMIAQAVVEFTRAAADLHHSQRFDDYIKVAERLLYYQADNRTVALKLARVYLERDEARRALPKLQICYQAQPRDPETLELLASAFEALNQVAKAVSVLRELVRVAQEKNDRERTTRAYQRILALVPGDAEAGQALGVAPGAQSQDLGPPSLVPLDMAARAGTPTGPRERRGAMSPGPTFLEDAAEESTATDPDVEELAKILSEVDIYRKYGLHDKALEHLQRILGRYPGHIEARERRWALLAQLGRTDEAVQELWSLYHEAAGGRGSERYLEELLRVRPGDAEAHRLLGAAGPQAAPAEVEEILDLGDDAVIEEMDALGVREEVEIGEEPPAAARGRGARAAPGELEDMLERADVFLQQGMLGEARALLVGLGARFPAHPLVAARLRDLEALERAALPAGVAEREATSVETASGIAALARAAVVEGGHEPPPAAPAGPRGSAASVSRVVQMGATPEDFDTRYDLGIAYKEMGLLDDAIGEFKAATQDPVREVQCHMMIGLCLIEKSQVSDAVSQFKKGLYASNIQAQEELAIYFEMGRAYELLKDGREALYYYEKVFKRDPHFRDVERRIASLRGESDKPAAPAHESDDIDAAFAGLVSDGERK